MSKCVYRINEAISPFGKINKDYSNNNISKINAEISKDFVKREIYDYLVFKDKALDQICSVIDSKKTKFTLSPVISLILKDWIKYKSIDDISSDNDKIMHLIKRCINIYTSNDGIKIDITVTNCTNYYSPDFVLDNNILIQMCAKIEKDLSKILNVKCEINLSLLYADVIHSYVRDKNMPSSNVEMSLFVNMDSCTKNELLFLIKRLKLRTDMLSNIKLNYSDSNSNNLEPLKEFILNNDTNKLEILLDKEATYAFKNYFSIDSLLVLLALQ